VPVLIDGELAVWDSLAIMEYAAERWPEIGAWPRAPEARALARSISAEMHSGFVPLRSACGMNLHRPVRAVALSDEARANVARIEEIWSECLMRHNARGPFLFGAFSAADAMFAPVVHRFRTYAIEVSPQAKAYMDTMWTFPAFAEWTRDGLAETIVIPKFEND
jgi:glutathione S-transferase